MALAQEEAFGIDLEDGFAPGLEGDDLGQEALARAMGEGLVQRNLEAARAMQRQCEAAQAAASGEGAEVEEVEGAVEPHARLTREAQARGRGADPGLGTGVIEEVGRSGDGIVAQEEALERRP